MRSEGDDSRRCRLPIEQARSELIEVLRDLDGLTMIGIGEREGSRCLRVYVTTLDDATRGKVPERHGGWPVDLQQADRPEILA